MNKTKVDELRDALKKKEDPSVPKEERAPEGTKDAEATFDLTEQIRIAEEEAKGHYDKLLRMMAEFENFKKRMAKEREDFLKYSNDKLLTELLPSLDDLDRVLDHVPPDATAEVKAIADGVELVRKSLTGTLDRFGLKDVPALGEVFDPACHEAIATVESEAHEPGHVVALHRKGYRLGDRLLRPAMVTVAKTREVVVS